MRPLSLNTPKSVAAYSLVTARSLSSPGLVRRPLFPIAGRAIIWHGLQACSKVPGLTEVILIGFYEDAVFAQFIRDASKDFADLKIRYLREFQSLGTAGGLYHFRDVILKGNPDQIYVLHADIACSYPLEELTIAHNRHRGVGTIMGVKVAKEVASKYGCIVVDADTQQAKHYVEKPESFLSDTINGGVYLFDKAIFDELRKAVESKTIKSAKDDLSESNTDQLRLEQDVIAPLVENNKLWVYTTTSFWRQIKTAGSAVPANALVLASYKSTNPALLRVRSPTVSIRPVNPPIPAAPLLKCEVVEPCYIDETAQIDPSVKIGPNVSIGANVKIAFGARVKDAIVLDGTSIDANACILHAIIGEDCRIGAWARVEGSPLVLNEEGKEKQTIAILANDVSVAKEVFVRSCIVLPQKSLTKSFSNEVLL